MRHLPGFSVAAPALVVLALVTQAGFGQSQSMQQMTPLLLAVHDAPIPFTGSDERLHLVYELWMTNFSSADVAVEKVEVLGDGSVLQTLDTASVASRLQPAGQRESTGTLPRSTQALLFLLVGNSGNSIAPHLHSQLTDGELPAASNGLPYEITSFHVTGETPGTKAFDEAEANGTPLAITPVSPPRPVKDALPLDQLIISFAAQ